MPHDDDDDIEYSFKLKPTKTVGATHLTDYFRPDDRPITPLKDKMIYDPVHSSLDFKDRYNLC